MMLFLSSQSKRAAATGDYPRMHNCMCAAIVVNVIILIVGLLLLSALLSGTIVFSLAFSGILRMQH